MGAEKRESPRKCINLSIIMHFLKPPTLFRGWVQNISLGGIRVKTENAPGPFQKGDKFIFIINENYLFLEGQGKVIWASSTEDEAGIKFGQLDEKMRMSVEEFMRLLS